MVGSCLLLGLLAAWAGDAPKREVPAFPADAKIFVFPVEGEVEEGLYIVLARALRLAEAGGYSVFVLDMNTPGGAVDSMRKMTEVLLHSSVYTITFVDIDATSAGSLLALSTRQIFMKRGGTIGSAAPIVLGGDMAEMDDITREKITGYVRSTARAAAEANGYPVEIAEAFVSASTDLADPPVQKGFPLSLTSDQAVKYRIATAVVDNLDEILKDHLGISSPRVDRYSETFFERVGRFLSGYTVSYLLMVAALILAYLEFKTPGFGIFGFSSAICFALYFWGSSVAGLAGTEALFLFLLVIVGFVLIGLEIFVIPGFGLPGIAGILLIMLGLTLGLARVPLPEIHADPAILLRPALIVGAAVVTSFAALAALVMFLPATPLWNHLSLAPQAASGPPPDSPITGSLAGLAVGQEGVAISNLRPAGIALFSSRRVSVTADGGYVESGSKVRVVKLETHDVHVRRA